MTIAHPLPSSRVNHASAKGLPSACYAFFGERSPGHRIVLVRAGVKGYIQADLDDKSLAQATARVLVDRTNVELGVTDAQQQAMIAGAVYGFHVPLADPAHPYHAAHGETGLQVSIANPKSSPAAVAVASSPDKGVVTFTG